MTDLSERDLSDRVIYAPKYHLDDRTIKELTRLARARKPYEACGLLMPPCWDHYPSCNRVMELENAALRLQAKDPSTSYVMASDAVKTAVHTWIGTHVTFRENNEPPLAEIELKQHFSVWHTHPHGGVGPSHGDLLNTVPGFSYLVCTLMAHEGGSTITMAWF